MISCLPRGHSMTLHSLGLDHPAGYSAVEVFSGTSLGHFNPTDTFTGDVNPTGKCSWARIFFRRVASPPHFYILLMRVCDTHHCGVFSTFFKASSFFLQVRIFFTRFLMCFNALFYQWRYRKWWCRSLSGRGHVRDDSCHHRTRGPG